MNKLADCLNRVRTMSEADARQVLLNIVETAANYRADLSSLGETVLDDLDGYDLEPHADHCKCGEPLDQDCNGRPRCPVCDPPCPCCYDGGGPR